MDNKAPPEDWRLSINGVLTVGRMIKEAHDSMAPNEYAAAVAGWMLDGSTAIRLMKISINPVISNPANADKLPSQWGKLYELALMPPDMLQSVIDKGDAKTITKYEIWKMREDAGNRVRATPRLNGEASPYRRRPLAYKAGDRRARSKMTVKLPEGKTYFDLAKEGLAIEEQENIQTDVVASRIGLGIMAYRQLRTIYLLSLRTDLSDADRRTVDHAVAMVNDGYAIKNQWLDVQPIVEKIYGTKYSADNKSEKRRSDAFIYAVSLMHETCMRTTEVEVPHLQRKDIEDAVHKIHSARAALRFFSTQIKRKFNDGKAYIRPQSEGVQGVGVDTDEEPVSGVGSGPATTER